MRRLRHTVGWCAAVLVAAVACSGDGTGPNGNGGGGTTPTLSGNVQPILTASCALSGCHSGGTSAQPTGKPMDLSTATQTIQNTREVTALQAAMNRITPGNPDQSYLVHKIQGTQASVGGSGSRMPLTNCCLTQDQINTIRAWITAGAANN